MPAPRKNRQRLLQAIYHRVTGLKLMNAASKARPAIANAAFIAKFLPITPNPKSRKGIFTNTSITPSFAPVNCLIKQSNACGTTINKNYWGIKKPFKRQKWLTITPKEIKKEIS